MLIVMGTEEAKAHVPSLGCPPSLTPVYVNFSHMEAWVEHELLLDLAQQRRLAFALLVTMKVPLWEGRELCSVTYCFGRVHS